MTFSPTSGGWRGRWSLLLALAVVLALPARAAQVPAAADDAGVAEPLDAGAAKADGEAAKPAESAPSKPLAEAHPMKVTTTVEPAAEITLGEPLVWTIRIDHDASDTYSLPEKLDASPLALVASPQAQRKESAGLTTTTLRLTFADYLSAEPRVPDVQLRVEGPAGSRVLLVRGQALQLKSLVKAEGADSPEHAHHGPKPPVDVMVRSLLWLWLVLGIVAVIAAVVGVRRYLAWRAQRVAAQPVVQRAPDEEALSSLTRLKGDAPWSRGEGRSAIFQLSEIVRRYLGQRLRFHALDLTSDELLEQLRRRSLPGLEVDAFQEELGWEDLVKFAKLEPQPDECVRAIDGATALVMRTRLAPERAA